MTVDLLNSGDYSRDALVDNGHWFWGPGGVERFFSFSGHKSCMTAYQKCPTVSAIVNKKAQAFTNGRIFIQDLEGNEATGDIAKRIRKLMTRPNPLQTWKQFDAQGYIYQQIFGYCPVLAIKPVGFKENYYASALWNLPPFMCEIKETNAIFYQTGVEGIIQSITLKYKNQETELDPRDVLILRDFTPSFKTLVLPDSRLRALEMPVNNIIGAMESRNVLINYRGALGILSPEKDQFGVAPINDDAKIELQRDFLRYGLTREQWKFIISSAALKWQQMGIPTKDLMLMEEVIESTKMIADGFNYPPQLLGIIDPKYDNWSAAEQGLYQNAILPESESNYDQWNDFFKTADNGLAIYKDFTHVAALQADQVKLATARLTLNQAKKIEWETGLITLDDWKEALGDEPLPDGLGQVRVSDSKNSNVPLAVTLGVGGVQALIAVVTNAAMSPEGKKATLVNLFGIEEAVAESMVVEKEEETPETPEPPGPPAPPEPPVETEEP